MTARSIDAIVIHCAATPEGRPVSLAQITAMHKARGFRTVGYHYVILLDGTVAKGRPEAEVGAHVEGHNAHSIGVCYIGGLAADAKTPKDTRTDAQRAALADLVKDMHARYPKARICGHRDFSPDLNKDGVIQPREWMKACPSFDVAAWWAGVSK